MLHSVKIHMFSSKDMKDKNRSLANQQKPAHAATSDSQLSLWSEAARGSPSPIVTALAAGRGQNSCAPQGTPHEIRVSFHYGLPLVFHKRP